MVEPHKAAANIGAVLLCGALAACAPTPSPSPPRRINVQQAPYRPFPATPEGYENRFGQVVAKCTVLPDRTLANCSILAAEGGPAYGDAVLAWLNDPRHPPVASRPDNPDPTTHIWTITFSHAGKQAPSVNPVSGGHPVAPSGYKPPRKGGLLADCIIEADGAPRDCRILVLAPDDPQSRMTLAWLNSGRVHYQAASYPSPGSRRIVQTPPPS